MRESNQQRLILHLLKGNGGLQMIQALLIFMPGGLVLGIFFSLTSVLINQECFMFLVLQIHECTLQFA
jgi:hypothetical protein